MQSAYRAMTELNGTRLGDSKIQVEEAKPRDGDQKGESNNIVAFRNSTNIPATMRYAFRNFKDLRLFMDT